MDGNQFSFAILFLRPLSGPFLVIRYRPRAGHSFVHWLNRTELAVVGRNLALHHDTEQERFAAEPVDSGRLLIVGVGRPYGLYRQPRALFSAIS